MNVTVKCDGKKQLTEPDRKNEIVRPLLTDEEAEANYRYPSARPKVGTYFVL